MFERGIPICIGSDSNTIIDPVIEIRELEAIARRQAERRNVLVPDGADGPTPYLLAAGSANGARALGISHPLLEVEITSDHPHLTGVAAEHAAAALVFGGSAAALRPVTS